MIPKLIGKLIGNAIEKKIKSKISDKFNLDKIKSYVEDDNELDLISKMHGKALDKYGRTIENNEKEIAILKKNSHPPIFTEKDIKGILKRLKKLEKRRK